MAPGDLPLIDEPMLMNDIAQQSLEARYMPLNENMSVITKRIYAALSKHVNKKGMFPSLACSSRKPLNGICSGNHSWFIRCGPAKWRLAAGLERLAPPSEERISMTQQFFEKLKTYARSSKAARQKHSRAGSDDENDQDDD